jgi:hypothetical protein
LAGAALAGLGFAAWSAFSAAGRAGEEPAAGEPGPAFSAVMDDLPIMPGLLEEEAGYAFELDRGGRLAEVRLTGEAEPATVRGFYAATLGQLGWKPSATEPYVYRRGRERLIFLIEPRRLRRGSGVAKGLDVIFVVMPEGDRRLGLPVA